MNKFFLAGILIAALTYSVNSQSVEELKYKDIYEIVLSGNKSKAFENLLSYQKQDPHHPNTYYHLGYIAFEFAKEKDPLRDYSDMSYFLYHSNLFYNLCLKYLDEKEARKNWEMYNHIKPADGAKRVEYEQLVNHIKNQLSEVADFKKNIETIRDNYYGAVRNYTNCLNTFKQIADKNNKLKDIYLTANEQLINEIKDIGTDFDSTRFYFDNYKSAIKTFPIKNYNQDYKLVPIETYRLDGLTKSDFLKNDISLWDYRSWSDTVLAVIEKDISKLRMDIESEGKKIESLTNLMNITKDYSSNYDYYSMDVEFGYRVGRYDFQPLILDLFNYNVNRLNLMIDSKNPINNPAHTNDSTLSLRKKLLFYKDLVNRKIEADNELKILNKNLTSFNVLKYQSYIDEQYKGEKGLRNYLSKEPSNLETLMDASMENLKKNIVEEQNRKHNSPVVIKNKTYEIPLAISALKTDNPETGKYYTTSVAINTKGDYYITGFLAKTENKTTAFVAKSDSSFNIKWVKKVDFSSGKKSTLMNYGDVIDVTDDGCIVIVHTRDLMDGNLTIANKLLRYNGKGEELTRQPIGPGLVPRLMMFDAINEKITAVYKGKQLQENADGVDTLMVSYSDSVGRAIWQTQLQLNGNVVNIIRSNKNLILVGNYSKLIFDNNEQSLSGSKANAFLSVFNSEGSIISLKKYNDNFTYYLTHSIKLDSETLNLVGFKTDETNLSKIENKSDIKLEYMLVNTNGNILYQY